MPSLKRIKPDPRIHITVSYRGKTYAVCACGHDCSFCHPAKNGDFCQTQCHLPDWWKKHGVMSVNNMEGLKLLDQHTAKSTPPEKKKRKSVKKSEPFRCSCDTCANFSYSAPNRYSCPHMHNLKHWDWDRAFYCKHFFHKSYLKSPLPAL